MIPNAGKSTPKQLAEKILSSTDYRDVHIGPQLLDARARAWNRRSLVMVVGVRGVVTDVDGKPFIVRHNYAQGFTPEEMYACVVGARQGFAQIHVQSEQMIQEARKARRTGRAERAGTGAARPLSGDRVCPGGSKRRGGPVGGPGQPVDGGAGVRL